MIVITPQELVDKARAAKENAYAPYSNFMVGAALLATDGQIYIGCNVENSSYGLTICAERVAIFNALAHGQRNFTALAVAADTEDYIIPCGACCQVLAEIGAAMQIYLANREGHYTVTTVAELLPRAFVLKGDKA